MKKLKVYFGIDFRSFAQQVIDDVILRKRYEDVKNTNADQAFDDHPKLAVVVKESDE
jgi:hypothetical protein